MAVKVFEGVGADACPEGHYALYEHAECNTDPRGGRMLVADEPIADLDAHGFGHVVSSVVNKTGRPLRVFIGATIEAGQSMGRLPRGLNDNVTATSLDDGSVSAVDSLRNTFYAAAGGSVDGQGKGQGASGPLAGVADTAFTATGGTMTEKTKPKASKYKKGDQVEFDYSNALYGGKITDVSGDPVSYTITDLRLRSRPPVGFGSMRPYIPSSTTVTEDKIVRRI
ncbi:hypothetical protein HDA32_002411 [Spinactinospora alkalitolerans]|uniref:Uncharacterized protein n=1 Tax=Spinactinospora alkalitolerans TaxID=687207 RepID=A0A852TUE6_9ACTN|nr:hypothetical protein [Spinactinospora alkalitolerans]NYE47291.1 hypothetical protein [Spinactinospora alkalitolerans]